MGFFIERDLHFINLATSKLIRNINFSYNLLLVPFGAAYSIT